MENPAGGESEVTAKDEKFQDNVKEEAAEVSSLPHIHQNYFLNLDGVPLQRTYQLDDGANRGCKTDEINNLSDLHPAEAKDENESDNSSDHHSAKVKEESESNNVTESNSGDTGEDGKIEDETEGEDEDDDEDDDEDNDEEDDDDDEEEEEEPPLLKYTRITKLPASLFSRDSISACLFLDEFFLFGTHSGLLHLTRSDFTAIQTIKCHRSSILSIHSEGAYFATASIDGTVVIGMIHDLANITAFDFKRPVQAVVLAADYKTSKTFVSGGMAGDVVLSQRNWLGNRMDIVLSRGNGPIIGIYTMDDVILWMNDAGITFCGIHSKAQLLNVPFPQEGSNEVRPDLYRPHVHFPEVDRITVAWGNHIWMFKISLAKSPEQGANLGSILSSAASSLRAAPDKKVELEHHFSIKMHIAGISSFKDDQLMCLGFSEFDDKYSVIRGIPEIKIIDTVTGEEVHNDAVVVKNYKNLTLNDYHLGKHIENASPEYFLISATGAIRIQVLTLKDHYEWYVEKEDYLQAWQIGKYVVDDYSRLETGLKGIAKLMENNQWDEAASQISIIVSNTNIIDDPKFKEFAIKKWENIFEKIIESSNVDSIAQKIPLDPPFKKSLYDGVLDFYLKRKNMDSFVRLLKKWPPRLFSTRHFEDRLEESIEEHDSSEISYREAIIYLYLSESRYSKAVSHMLVARDIRALDILLSHSLISQFKDKIIDIVLLPYDGNLRELARMHISEIEQIFDKPIELLVQSRHSLKISDMIALFTKSEDLRVILFLYLKKISTIDPVSCAPFENKLIELYALFDKDHLLNFLKSRSNYDAEEAIEFCSKQKGFSGELIYLWGKIGENKKALSLIIDDLNDPHLAIEFVKNWGDSDLWEFMIGYSMDKPKFVKALLDSPDEFGKTYLEVAKAMPTNMHIEGLQVTLNRISKDSALNLRVRKSVLKIVDDETKEVCATFLKVRSMGKIFEVGGENAAHD